MVSVAASGALRATFFGALFVPAVGVVSCGISSVPGAKSLGDVVVLLSMGIVVFTFLGWWVVLAGVLWGLFSVPLLSLPWLRARASGQRRTVVASIMGLLSGG